LRHLEPEGHGIVSNLRKIALAMRYHTRCIVSTSAELNLIENSGADDEKASRVGLSDHEDPNAANWFCLSSALLFIAVGDIVPALVTRHGAGS
jgi:hypothetical protein